PYEVSGEQFPVLAEYLRGFAIIVEPPVGNPEAEARLRFQGAIAERRGNSETPLAIRDSRAVAQLDEADGQRGGDGRQAALVVECLGERFCLTKVGKQPRHVTDRRQYTANVDP